MYWLILNISLFNVTRRVKRDILKKKLALIRASFSIFTQIKTYQPTRSFTPRWANLPFMVRPSSNCTFLNSMVPSDSLTVTPVQ